MNIDLLSERRFELSTYNYVQNSPMIRFDPNGLTDFKLNKKTGEVTQVGEANDSPDRILKTNRKGKIKYYKRGKNKGQAKVAINNIEKGILKDGQNFKNENNLIKVGGEGQPTKEGVESFALKLSGYVGKEIGGVYFSENNDNKTTHIGLGKYVKNEYDRTNSNGIGTIRNSKGRLGPSNVMGFFHTHPQGSGLNDSDRLVPSDQDLDFRDNALKINPTLKFYILTNPNPGEKEYPKKINFTTGFSRRLK